MMSEGENKGDEGGNTGGEGVNNEPASWKQSIPEDLRESPALKDVSDVGSLAKQFVDQQAYLGNAIRVPGPDAGKEDIEAFETKLREKVPGLVKMDFDNPDTFSEVAKRFGAPEDKTAYKLPELDEVPEGLAESPLAEVLREAGVESNLTQKQFETVARKFTESQIAMAQANQEAMQAELGELAKKWGNQFDARKDEAARAAELTGAPPAMVEAMKEGKVRAEVYEWMHSIASKLGAEFNADDGQNRKQVHGMTPDEANAQLDEIMSNREHPYWTALPGTPEKENAIKRVLKLREDAMGPEGKKTFTLGESIRLVG